MNLFFKNSPLHDGAVIISNNHIVAARCTLPITEKTDIPPSFGMRHKAAIGITEETDADFYCRNFKEKENKEIRLENHL